MATYFISDIHLNTNTEQYLACLLKFLRTTAPKADAVYILGDLFALWLGDDINPTYAQQVCAALATLADQNIPVYVMRGNRDFLLGQRFCTQAKCTLLPDPCVIDLYGQKVLLTHGDLLCTADLNYQRFRKIVQNQLIKALFLAIPKPLRIRLGNWVKYKINTKSKNNQHVDLYDVENETVNAWFKKYQTKIMIHGHTHKPAVHTMQDHTRIVLGDWNQHSAQILVATKDSTALLDLYSN